MSVTGHALQILLAAIAFALASGPAAPTGLSPSLSDTANTSDTDASAGAAAFSAAEKVTTLRERLKLERRASGPYAQSLIPILTELADAELAIGEKEYAAARLERVVELTREHEGRYTQSLMIPLLRLANIYMGAGRFEKAIAQLRYAQHLTHRRDGVYSLDQIALIEELARAFLGQDQSDEAQREMKLAFDLSKRVHGEENIEHVPGMMRFAAWFKLVGEDRKARRLYIRSIERLEEANGPEHYSLIEPLTHLASTASRMGYYRSEREAALLRADHILNRQPGADAEDKAASAVRLGDFYTRLRQAGDAELQYQRAWEILADSDDPRIDHRRIFSQPVVLNFPYSMLPDTRRGLILHQDEVKVTYELDINADGKVTRVKLLEHDGPVALNRTLRKNAFALRFRPRIEDGQAVETSAHRMTESIRLDPPVSRSLFMKELRKEMARLANMLRVSGRVR